MLAPAQRINKLALIIHTTWMARMTVWAAFLIVRGVEVIPLVLMSVALLEKP